MIRTTFHRGTMGLALVASVIACAHPDPEPASADAGAAATVRESVSAAPSVSSVLPAPSAPSYPSASGGGEITTDLCKAVCARSEHLQCPGTSGCVPRCEQMRAMTGCQEAISGALDCFLTAPTTAWMCNTHGLPSIQPGMCEEQQARAARCLAAGPPSPLR
jgi:hypothetical protein